MAETHTSKARAPDGGDGVAVSPSSGQPKGLKPLLRASWPVPALVLAIGVLAAGLYSVWSSRPKADPSLPLQVAERLVAGGQYEEAIEALNGPALGFKDSGLATRRQEARFHLARARAFAGQQARLGVNRVENHRQIVADFKRAEELGIGVAGDVGGSAAATPEHPGEHDRGGAAHGLAEAEGNAEHQVAEGLTASDFSSWIESLIATDNIDESLARIAKLPSGAVGEEGDRQRARKLRLTRLLVEHNLRGTDPKQRRDSLTLDLLAKMATDPDLSRDDHAWVLARQSELLLALNRVEEAITKLLRELQRLQDVPPARQGELYVLLGKAYVEVGQDAEASRQLEAADRLLAAGDSNNPLRADAAVLLGRLAQRSPKGKDLSTLEQARERYAVVTTEFRGSRAYMPAVLGLAEIDAASREFDRSIDRYSELVQSIVNWKPPQPPIPREADRGVVSASLMARWGELFEEAGATTDAVLRLENLQQSLRYAQVAESLYPTTGPGRAAAPADLLLALGRTHRRLADEIMEAARDAQAGDFSVRNLDPATRAEVKRHYLSAAEAYRRHAERMSSEDTAAFSASLWISADSFELAGDLDEAAKAFGAFIDGAADGDPNRPEARFRLARIFEAQGDYSAAQSLFESLRAGGGDALSASTSGAWADRSIVPLALCYLADRDPANDERAEQLLKSVVEGRLIGPESKDYRDALVELGNHYYATGRYTDAISRFEEVVNRYASETVGEGVVKRDVRRPQKFSEDASPEAGQSLPTISESKLASIRFKLADSHRLEAGRIARTLQGALPQTVENRLKSDRSEHLVTAMEQFGVVRASLETLPVSKQTELDRTFLRNSYFSIGDCAFELGDYSRAIAAYDAAALRYIDDPASLVAMVQIVNAYTALGQPAQARAANERARRQLSRFPDEVWSRADLPMEKKHWERWLESRQALDATASAGEGG